MSKEAAFHYAAEFIAAKRGRAMARSNLAKLRRQWHQETESYYDPSERDQLCEELYPLADAIDAALKEREACNRQYRKVLRKLDIQFAKGLVWQSATGTVDLEYRRKHRVATLGEEVSR